MMKAATVVGWHRQFLALEDPPREFWAPATEEFDLFRNLFNFRHDAVIRHYYVRAQTLTLQCVHTGGVSPRVVGSPPSAPHSRPAGGMGIACRAPSGCATRGNSGNTRRGFASDGGHSG